MEQKPGIFHAVQKCLYRSIPGKLSLQLSRGILALAKKMHGTNSALKRDLEKVLVVKEDKKLDIPVSPLSSMKELASKVTEVMQKFNDWTMKGE